MASGGLLAAGEEGATPGSVAMGVGAGVGGYGIGKGIGYGVGKLGQFAQNKIGQALAKATAEKAAQRAQAVGSAGGSLGGARAEANRVVEAIRGLLSEPSLTSAQRESLLAMQGTPEYAQAVDTLVGSLKNRLPEVAGKVSQAEAGVAAANALPSVAEQAAERVTPRAAWEYGIKPRLKRYGPLGLLGAVAGHAFAGPGGALLGGAAGAAVRPAFRAMVRGARDPAVQTMLLSPVARAAGAAGEAAPVARSEVQALVDVLRAKYGPRVVRQLAHADTEESAATEGQQ